MKQTNHTTEGVIIIRRNSNQQIAGKITRGIIMIKKIISLAVILVLSLSLFGCAKKGEDLTPEREEFIRELTEMGVSFEVTSRYGLKPVVTTEKITAYDDSDKENGIEHMTFYTEGTYSVMTDTNEVYSGTFEAKGHIEAHGAGTDKCEISEPRNGFSVLPEQSTEVIETAVQSDATSETTFYQPLAEYIHEHTGSIPSFITPSIECDINRDGYPELCSTVTMGSGLVSSFVAVYDVHNDRGYMLGERGTYDYGILGASDDTLAVSRRKSGEDGEVNGVVSIEDDELVFIDEDTYRSNGGV